MLDKHTGQGNEEYDLSIHIEMLSILAELFEKCFSSVSDLMLFLLLPLNPFEFDLSKSGSVYQRLRVDKRKFKEQVIYFRTLDDDKANQLKREGVQEL